MPDLQDLNNSLVELETELEKVKSAAELVADSKDAAKEAAEAAKRTASNVSTLAAEVSNLVGRIQTQVDEMRAVDFPKRFASIDESVEGVKNTVKKTASQQAALVQDVKKEVVERSDGMKKEVREGFEGTKKSFQEQITKRSDALTKELLRNRYYLLGVLGLLILVLALELFRR